ncbi:hypothetical protein ACIPWL_30545 [Streptomyces sp. NPDC090023]|uniref:hypothetical protein n=1 Tax=unclassified Streptomyces TaxID=2593676 RepID=UPI00380F8755
MTDDALIIVHRPSVTGGRKVTAYAGGRKEDLGLAHSDHDVIVFLEAAGMTDPEEALDDPQIVNWRGAPAHHWQAP